MINKRTGNMLDVTSGFLVHGCNAQGIMGSGLAKYIRYKWSEVYCEYVSVYSKDHKLSMGGIIPVVVDNIVVINAITQKYYTGHPLSKGGREVDYQALAECFEQINLLPDIYPDIEPVLHYPYIGAGQAKGNWTIINAIIDQSITKLEKIHWVLP